MPNFTGFVMDVNKTKKIVFLSRKGSEEDNYFLSKKVVTLLTSFTKQTRLQTIESLRNDDDDSNGNENGKKAILIGLDWQKNNFARASRFFVHFFAVTARLGRENAA